MIDQANPDMTFEQYLSIDALNWSRLKHLSQSPLQYLHAISEGRPDTAAMVVGRAAHTCLFEFEKFDRQFCTLPEDAPRRPSALQRSAKKPSPETLHSIEWWDAFSAKTAGMTILTPEQMRQAMDITTAVRSNPVSAPYLAGAEFEQSVVWTDAASGEQCKARIDWWSGRKRALIDLKTTSSIDAHAFGRVAARLGYPSQMAHYYNAMTQGLGHRVDEVVIVAVESKPPHDVAVFIIDDAALAAGQKHVAELIARLVECRAEGHWPGRYPEPQPLLLPAYAYGDEEIDLGEGA